MFFFRKRKKGKTKKEKIEEPKKVIDVEKINALIRENESKFESAEDEAYVTIANELGNLHYQLGNHGNAINYYEKSLEASPAIGKAYTELMKLYNIKMREANKAKESDQVQVYMKKLDDLTQLSKDTIRGRV